jgi:hypothetical protein
VHTEYRWGTLRERDHMEVLGVYVRIILNWILKSWDGSIDWIYLAQDSKKWCALVSAVINLRVS